MEKIVFSADYSSFPRVQQKINYTVIGLITLIVISIGTTIAVNQINLNQHKNNNC